MRVAGSERFLVFRKLTLRSRRRVITLASHFTTGKGWETIEGRWQEREFLPLICHCYVMTATIKLDASNRIVLSRDLRRAAGIPPGQKLKVLATPGRIVLEVEPNAGKIVKRGKLKLWAGQVPSTPLEEAVEQVRHYER